MTNIVKNNSKADGYNYTSLSDIASQGFEIPRMKTGTENEKEYVYVYDKESKEWIRGAEIVIPLTKSQNEAQQYGSALTYARRYSVLLYLGLCSEDDKKLETKAPAKATDKQIEYFKKLYSAVDVAKILQHYQVENCEDLPMEIVSQYINEAKKRNEERNKQ